MSTQLQPNIDNLEAYLSTFIGETCLTLRLKWSKHQENRYNVQTVYGHSELPQEWKEDYRGELQIGRLEKINPKTGKILLAPEYHTFGFQDSELTGNEKTQIYLPNVSAPHEDRYSGFLVLFEEMRKGFIENVYPRKERELSLVGDAIVRKLFYVPSDKHLFHDKNSYRRMIEEGRSEYASETENASLKLTKGQRAVREMILIIDEHKFPSPDGSSKRRGRTITESDFVNDLVTRVFDPRWLAVNYGVPMGNADLNADLKQYEHLRVLGK